MAQTRQGTPLPESRQRPDWRTGSQISRSGKYIDVELLGTVALPKITGNTTITGNLITTGTVTANSGIVVEAWTAPSLGASWANYGSGQQTARYRKTPDGTVHIQGCIAGGTTTASTVLFTLPAGYLPDAAMTFVVEAYPGAHASMEVLANGAVRIVAGFSATYTWINCSYNI